MTAKEIIDFLSQYPEETEVAVYDCETEEITSIEDLEFIPDCGIQIAINQC